MTIAIHNNNHGFSPRWVAYCQQHGIAYKLVNAYDSDIIAQVKDCDAFMWHFHQSDYRDMLFARPLLRSLNNIGIRTFPDINASWHFDDKVAQKYLFETIDAPLVPTYVFYDKKTALNWVNTTNFPKVFKLRGGAGASNVKLARSRKDAQRFIRKAFGRGFPQFDRLGYLKDRVKKGKDWHQKLRGLAAGMYRIGVGTPYSRMHGPEKGYVYFQDFIPANDSDIRVCVVADRAFAIKRMTRKGDFRASGSGYIVYDINQIDERCVKIAFEVNQRLHMRSAAFDFVFDETNHPLIVEVSYGFTPDAYDLCQGYWTPDMQFHPSSHFDFCGWMVEDLIHKQTRK